MSALYRTEAVNHDGGDGVSRVRGGLEVTVSSPLATDFDPTASNPEQLLALAWVTCLNATAQAIVGGDRRTSVRAVVELHAAQEARMGYEFHADAYLSVEGADDADSDSILAAAHARCPVSKLLRNAANVRVHTEPHQVS